MQERSMVDSSILDTQAFKLIKKEYGEETGKGANYICGICWKTGYRTNVIELDPAKYGKKLFEKCHTNKYSHDKKICRWKGCDRAWSKRKCLCKYMLMA